MEKQNVWLIIWFIAIAFAFSSCQKSAAENNQSTLQLAATSSSSGNLNPKPVSKLDSSIRKIDFKNFTYLWTEDFSTDYEKSFTLKDGEIPFEWAGQMGVSLIEKEYADVTNDKTDEAILTISIQTGGTALPNLIYIYTLENEQPKLLWSFDTGDRAQGGLKKVYAENSNLIVETFGDNKFENDKWDFHFPKDKFKGYCCPTAFTKISFKWNGSKFVTQGKPELFDYDSSKEGAEN